MAAIYLRHAIHGEKVACGEAEAAYDEKSGWTRFTVPDPRAAAPDPVVVSDPVVEPEAENITYVVTATNGMQPSNAMPKPRRRRSAVNDDS
jgi:hypothetical protein